MQYQIEVNFAEPSFGDEERAAVARVMAGKWLASGQENEAFEREFASLVGAKYALCVNSGSSANLLALAALDLPKGAKVLTSACGFPATLSPILHLGLEPVLVDYAFDTLNIDVQQAVDAIERERPAAVLFAHTLGSPVDMGGIVTETSKYGGHVLEDCCEALGAEYLFDQVGTHGCAGTFSFYPSHHITALGGGGMVVFAEEWHYRRAKSLRDWGKRADWDKYKQNNTVYTSEVDGVLYFPHYTYETVGWNFKLPEANAAFGRVQLDRLSGIVEARRRNWAAIHARVGALSGLMPYSVPLAAQASPFGYPLVLEHPLDRNRFGDFLETWGVRHRPFFAGNIVRHAPFSHLTGRFPVADLLMKQALFVGCHQNMTEADCDYVAEIIEIGLHTERKETHK